MTNSLLSPDDLSFIDTLFATFFARKQAPGLTYGVTYKGHVVHARALGHRTLSPLEPVSTTTPFRIASMTKSFAAAALLQLRNEGRVSLEASVQSAVPKIPLAEPFSSATLHDLISMRLDLPVDDPWADRQMGEADHSFTQFFSQPLLRAQEGEGRCSYSNLSYFLLGRVISEVSGRSALEYITDRILRPLNLTSTCWNPDAATLPACSCGYRWDGSSWQTEEYVPIIGDGAVFAGLWTSLDDVATWLDFLRAGGSPNSTYERVLSSSARREMQGSYSWMAPTTFTRTEDNSTGTDYPSYGYGLRNEVIDGLHYSGHSGGIPGYGSHMRINLETGFGVVAFGNGTYCPTYEVCREALDFIARKTFTSGTLLHDTAQRLGNRLAQHILSGGDSCDQDLFIETMHLDYPPQEFIRDIKQRVQKLGDPASVTIESISAKPGALGHVVLTGTNGSATLQFGISPFGAPERIQSVKWIEPF